MENSQHTTAGSSLLKNKTLLICLGLLGAVGTAIYIFNVSISTAIFLGFALACPLMHVWMMKNGGHKH